MHLFIFRLIFLITTVNIFQYDLQKVISLKKVSKASSNYSAPHGII